MGKLLGTCSLCGGEVKKTSDKIGKCVLCGATETVPVVETTKEGTQLLQG